MATPREATRRGRIEDFDDDAGLGSVRDLDDAVVRPFHCTAVGDGSRRIEAGTEVTYRLAPGRHGRTEASDIRPVRAQSPP